MLQKRIVSFQSRPRANSSHHISHTVWSLIKGACRGVDTAILLSRKMLWA